MSFDILITGASGQVGWELERRSGTAGLNARAMVRAELDVSHREQVRRVMADSAPKVVINTAAYTAVDKAESQPTTAMAVNRDGPAYLAEACEDAGAALIHFSTDYVFDGTKKGAYVETDEVGPISTYGASKLAGEVALRSRLKRHVILRTSWVYGVHGNNFVKTMLRLGKERPQLRVVDDQIGCPTFAGDLADAALEIAGMIIAGKTTPQHFGTFHCAGAGAVTWCGFARAIVGMAGARLGAQPTVDAITTAEYPTPAQRPANSVLDCSKLIERYGFALPRWETSLAEMLDGVYAAQT